MLTSSAGRGKRVNVSMMDKRKFKHAIMETINQTKRNRTITFSSTTDIVANRQKRMNISNHESPNSRDQVMKNYPNFLKKCPKKYLSMKAKISSLTWRVKLFLTLPV